jgi:hypothetical protein
MGNARIAAVVLALCASTTLAQQQAKTTLTVLVADQTGARVPGARIAATNQATGSQFDAVTDNTGQAVVDLDQGTYKLTVRSQGFETWVEENVELTGEMHKDVTLVIGGMGCGVCVVPDVPEMPLERPPAVADIPLIPLQQLALPAKPFRQKHQWLRRNPT